MNDHQGKALEEGCHEREWARTSASSREKTNTKRNLARAILSPRAGHRQSLMDVLVEWAMNRVVEECPNVRDLVK